MKRGLTICQNLLLKVMSWEGLLNSQAFQINPILSKVGLKLNIFARSSVSAYFPIRPQSDIANFGN